MGSEKQYTALFRANRQLICAHSTEAMNSRRDAALALLESNGLPTRRTEEYRYTDMQRLFAPDYGLNLRRLPTEADPREAFSCGVHGLSTLLFFVVNDTFRADAMPAEPLPEGLEIGSMATFCANDPHFVASRYDRLASESRDTVAALNTMLAQDALVVRIREGQKIGKTVQVLNLLCSDTPLMANRRVLIVAEKGSEASLLFCDHAIGHGQSLTTQAVEVYIDEGARLDLCCLEETREGCSRASTLFAIQQKASRFAHHSLTLGCGITRNSATVSLEGEGAECALNGLVIADGGQHADNNTLIRHRSPGCESHQLYKYVVGGHATGAFAGKVLVEKGAGKTVSDEVNQNLCTTRQARMLTQPMLEIYADDVKCSHGSATGQLSEAAMFYMRQRGLPPEEARRLLETAFASEVVDKIGQQPLRDRLRLLVEKRFRGDPQKCAQCNKTASHSPSSPL